MTSPGGQGRHFQVIWLSVLGTPKGQMVCRIDPVEYEIRINFLRPASYDISALRPLEEFWCHREI